MIRLCFFRYQLLVMLFLAAGINTLRAQSIPASTDIPQTISYQGLLTSSDGTPMADGEHRITVTLYSDQEGTTQLWQDSYTTTVNSGLFNLYLGSGTKALPPSIVLNTPLWIGTSIDNEEEMHPLTPLSASPYALNVPNGAITAEKVDMDYISELQINGKKVSGKGTVLNLVGTPSVPLNYDATTQSLTIGKPVSTGQKGNAEKGPSVLVGAPTLWSVGGDGYSLVGGGTGYTPGLGDWIGTKSPTSIGFLIKVNSTQIMNYQVSAGVPNIVGGGAGNVITVTSDGSVIAGGGSAVALSPQRNTITGNKNAVSGGESNDIFEGDYNVIGGGIDNDIAVAGTPTSYATIAGGEANRIEGNWGAIVGGDHNLISQNSTGSFIGAGGVNEIAGLSQRSGIVTGESNYINESEFTFVGGGTTNRINDPSRCAVIGGGEGNSLNGSSPHATIAGGELNNVTDGPFTAIGGGTGNQILTGDHNTISGGFSNQMYTSYTSTIGGGWNNLIDDNDNATIGGGYLNLINSGSDAATIAGGQENNVSGSAPYGSVGGGEGNVAAGSHSTIPGGDQLLTNPSYAQTAVGFFNKPRGTVGVRPNAATIAASNAPLFMVGNGDVNAGSSFRSNAFEVSYNGHTNVTGVNGGVAPSTTGGTYVDNMIYAWADVPLTTIGPIVIPISSFGVLTINRIGAGDYNVTINVTDAAGSPITLTRASITATIKDDVLSPHGCGMITTTGIGVPGLAANTFKIRTYDLLSGSCSPTDRGFMFKVTGRP